MLELREGGGRNRAVWGAAVGLLALACMAPPVAAPPAPPSAFSGEAAFAHLERLVAIGPRVSGTPGAEAARSYLRDALGQLGVEVQGQSVEVDRPLPVGRVRFENVIGVIPGESPDLVVLAAPYDSQAMESFPFLGANDGASGSALLLELARVFAGRPLPYTVQIAFLDGESPRRSEQSLLEGLTGSRLLVNELEGAGDLGRVRLAVYFNQVADADLAVTRDLYSHRVYRDAFFDTAARIGHGEAFPRQVAQGQPVGGHRAFVAVGVRTAVAIVDDRFGGDEPPGTHWRTERDDLPQCSAQSLEAVGAVTEVTLRGLAERWQKTDRYRSRPAAPAASQEPTEAVAPPEEPASEAAPAPEDPAIEEPAE